MSDLLYLFFSSLVISLVSFGGGAQALFYQTTVQEGLLSDADLSAVLAFGYATPGPAVFGIATFAGYHIGGLFGALVGTIGVFAMPCLLALVAAKYISSWLENPHARLFVKGVGLGAAGLVAAVAIQLTQAQNMEIGQVVIGVAAFSVMVKWKKTNPLWVLLIGGILGLIVE